MKTLVLASSSPRRKELLEKTGLNFTVDAVEIEELLEDGTDPATLAIRISLQKALAAVPRHPDSIVIAADTFGLLDGKFLGKPVDAAHAREMLLLMNGRRHEVITGFTIMDTVTGRTISNSVRTEVYFKKLSESCIDEYVSTGEPLDKAGAYAIQGLGAGLVKKINGDYPNVVGLPIVRLAEMLSEFGIKLRP